MKGGKLKAGKEVNTLLFGAAIAPALQTFPTARYDPASCKVDVWQASAQAIGLNIAGEFQEVDEKNGVSNRPFHRVMILMLTKPGMPAHTAGWPAVIANEQLHIGSGVRGAARAGGGGGAAAAGGGPKGKGKGKGKGKEGGSGGGGGGAAMAPGGGGASLLQQFMAQTRLKPAIAQQCLASNGNNLSKALFDFQTLKKNGKLQPQFFQ